MEQLGIDPIMILVQIINFALLLFVLKRFLYKPVLSAIQKRQETLEEITQGKEKIESKKKKLEEEEKKLRKEVQEAKEELLEEARLEAQKEKREIIEKANQNAKEILKNADQQAKRVVEEAEEEMRAAATEIASGMVTKVLAEIMDQEKKSDTVETAIRKLEGMEIKNV